ncbi:MAG: hypothetical protein LBK27_07365, partial [Treponema sp.]|nr:hypothetical protein [Treponema sp.]
PPMGLLGNTGAGPDFLRVSVSLLQYMIIALNIRPPGRRFFAVRILCHLSVFTTFPHLFCTLLQNMWRCCILIKTVDGCVPPNRGLK